MYCDFTQENAELLTEEGKLLQGVQGDDDMVDYDIDNYASHLGRILDRKMYLICLLKGKVASFRKQLQQQEDISTKIESLPGY